MSRRLEKATGANGQGHVWLVYGDGKYPHDPPRPASALEIELWEQLHPDLEVTPGSLWERDDEVFKVDHVYEAIDGNRNPVTLVKYSVVDPAMWHQEIGRFLSTHKPYDPEAE